MASVSDPARGSPPDPRKRPEIGPALTTPRSYYEIVRFCESLDTQEYFESLKITKLKVRVGTRSLDVSPLRLMFDKTIVDVSGLRYMYAAETTRDVLIFAISAHLRLRHIPRDLRFRIKELQYLLDFDVIPAIRCFKDHCGGDLDKFIGKWGDPFQIHRFLKTSCRMGSLCNQTPIPRDPRTLDSLPPDPSTLLRFAWNAHGQVSWPNLHMLVRYGTKRKIQILQILLQKWGQYPRRTLDARLYDLLEDARAVLRCFQDHHDCDYGVFITTWGSSLAYSHFSNRHCPGPHADGSSAICGALRARKFQ